ncbi:MAG TPA: hypothetical protein PLV83_04735 [Bacilli bacterium]|nr:hypothetical protein [Bacilli bacterium]
MKKEKNLKKNYVILIIMTIIVVFLCFYLASWYKTLKEYYQNNSIVAEVLSEIEAPTISSYLLDNPTTVIYIASSNDQEIKSFEKKFKKYIKEEDLNNNIIYFDSINLTPEYINELLIGYAGNELINLKNIVTPNMLYFENGKIVDILYAKKANIKLDDVKEFLENNKIDIND